MDVRPGGRARFDMVAGDGTLYTNRFDYLDVVPVDRMSPPAAEISVNPRALLIALVSTTSGVSTASVFVLRMVMRVLPYWPDFFIPRFGRPEPRLLARDEVEPGWRWFFFEP